MKYLTLCALRACALAAWLLLLSSPGSAQTDTAAPVVSNFTFQSANSTEGTFRIVFNEAVTGVDRTDFYAISTGNTQAAITTVTPVSGTTYTVAFSYTGNTGELQLRLQASGTGIIDAANNAFAGGGTLASDVVRNTNRTGDTAAPSVASFAAGAVGATSVPFTINFNEPVNGLSASSFTVSGAGASIASVLPTDTTGTTYGIVVNYTGTTGTISLALNSAAYATIRDFSDNAYAGGGTTSASASVGGTAPQPSSARIVSLQRPAAGPYVTGQVLAIAVTFDGNPVTITGTPRIALQIGNATRYATARWILDAVAVAFLYTITAEDADTDGITLGAAIDLNGGSIRVNGAAPATLNFAEAGIPATTRDLSGIRVNAVAVPAVIHPVSPMQVTGTAGSAQAFRYSLEVSAAMPSGNFTAQGLPAGFALDQVNKLIAGETPQPLNFTAQISHEGTPAVAVQFILAPNPTPERLPDGNDIGSVAVPLAGTYQPGQTLSFIVTQPFRYTVVGTPRLALTIGTRTRYAAFDSLSPARAMIFRYTVTNEDVDPDGIELGRAIEFPEGGWIREAPGSSMSGAPMKSAWLAQPNTSGIRVTNTAPPVDTTPPAAPVIAAISDDTGQAGDRVTLDDTLLFTGTAEPGSTVTLIRGAADSFGSAVATAGGTWSIDATSRPLTPGFHSFTATARDAAGNVSPASSAFVVARLATPPGAISVSASGGAIPHQSTTPSPGTGTDFGSATIGAAPVNRSFRIAGHGSNGVEITGVTITGDHAGDFAIVESPARVLFNSTGPEDSTLVSIRFTPSAPGLRTARVEIANSSTAVPVYTFAIQGTALASTGNTPAAPRIVSVLYPAQGFYGTGQSFSYRITYDAPVLVTGTPRLPLELRNDQPSGVPTLPSTIRYASYASGSGSNTLVFTYTVVAGDNDNNGIFATGQLELNGGTIRDSAGRDAQVTFVTQLIAEPIIDTTPPAAPIFTGISDDTDTPGDHVTTDATIILRGTAEPGSAVTLTQVGVFATVTADANGQWSYDNTAVTLTPATYLYTATARDRAGNVSPVSAQFRVVIQAPTSTAPVNPPPPNPPVTNPPVQPPPPTNNGGGGVIVKIPQTISFSAPVSAVFVGKPVELGATTSTNLPISYARVSGNATLTGSILVVHDTRPVTIRASSEGNVIYAGAEAEITLTAQKNAQSINLPAIANTAANAGPITLNVSADSGLPVTLSVSGPATLTGNTLRLTGVAGAVTVTARQDGNEAYNPAATVTRTFLVGAAGAQVGFGKLGSDDFALGVSADGSKGLFLSRLAATGQAIMAKFAVNANGTFRTETVASIPVASLDNGFFVNPTAAAGQTYTINGTLNNGVVSGTIVELGQSFTANIQPAAGSTAALAGVYTANVPGSASGDTYIVVGTAGQAYAVSLLPSGAISGTGTVTPAGVVSITTNNGGTINATLEGGNVSGSVATANAVSNLVGLSDSTDRTDRLINLSSRLRVTAGDANRSLIAGFVVTGTETKQVLVRAVGPGLASFGVSGALSTPTLQIFRGNTMVAQNAGWNNNADVASAAERVGAFRLNAGSRDAALLATLEPGAYTAVVEANGNNGIALVEVYDASTGQPLNGQELVNISTRGFVGTGDDQLIAGFVVSGNAPKRVLIRGIGPGLAQFGLNGAVADPQLKLFGANNTLVAQNDDWSTPQPLTGQLAATAAEVSAASAATGAFPLAANSRDAAIVITLMPGQYSAIVSGANNGTGAGLVEVYELSP